jgi:hypothetical protein
MVPKISYFIKSLRIFFKCSIIIIAPIRSSYLKIIMVQKNRQFHKVSQNIFQMLDYYYFTNDIIIFEDNYGAKK